ncbi:hypothetical protein [Acetivibrio ethanolgignens]|uniref:Uncharacterized protein n=1 Tax=Acetivibrio ethanolgignens TaxID=290052 RepID=A0A0V8QCU2_9FIRM|nr:hypothetical protein [Acetivibrio ethanolgignens]KSV58070.1 hypothetical protein ASU35_03275 [Acetivibrio ethanolgignens]
MKKLTTKILSLILTILMIFSLSVPAFAAESMAFKNSNISFTIVSSNETAYGTIYYVEEDGRPKKRTVWDVLDTAALLPLLPSTAYFREVVKFF